MGVGYGAILTALTTVTDVSIELNGTPSVHAHAQPSVSVQQGQRRAKGQPAFLRRHLPRPDNQLATGAGHKAILLHSIDVAAVDLGQYQ